MHSRREMVAALLGPLGAALVLTAALVVGLAVGLTSDAGNGVAAGGSIVTVWAAVVAAWATRQGRQLEDGVDRLNAAVDAMQSTQTIGRVYALVQVVVRVGFNIALEKHSGGVTRPTALAGAQELDVAGMACVERGLTPPEVVMKLAIRLQSVGIPARPGSPAAQRPDDLEELAGEALEAAVDWAQTKPWADAEAP